MVDDLEPSMKVIVVGNGMVGKTTLTVKFAKNIYTTEYKKTLGVDFLTKKRYVKSVGKDVEFYIWDTAGQDYYNVITKRYYRGADAALIVFSMTDKKSYEGVKGWKEMVDSECSNIPILLVMSKTDLIDQAAITDKQAVELANELGVNLVKVSSKDGTMISEVFDLLAHEHFRRGGKSNGLESIQSYSKSSSMSTQNQNPKVKTEVKEVENIERGKEHGFKLKAKTEDDQQEKPKKKRSFC